MWPGSPPCGGHHLRVTQVCRRSCEVLQADFVYSLLALAALYCLLERRGHRLLDRVGAQRLAGLLQEAVLDVDEPLGHVPSYIPSMRLVYTPAGGPVNQRQPTAAGLPAGASDAAGVASPAAAFRCSPGQDSPWRRARPTASLLWGQARMIRIGADRPCGLGWDQTGSPPSAVSDCRTALGVSAVRTAMRRLPCRLRCRGYEGAAFAESTEERNGQGVGVSRDGTFEGALSAT